MAEDEMVGLHHQLNGLESECALGTWGSSVQSAAAMLTVTSAHCCPSVTQSRPTLCSPVDCGIPGLPVLHHLPERTQTQVH